MTTRTRTLGASLGLVFLVLAAPAGATPSDAADLVAALGALKPASVSGTVTDAATGEGVAGVPVWLVHRSGRLAAMTATRGDGGYIVKAPHAGTYYVRAFGNADLAGRVYGDLPCNYDCDPTTGEPVTVAGRVTGIDLALETGGSLSGRITDAATGEPIVNVGVLLSDHTGARISDVTTDDDGRYTFTHLPAGPYYVNSLNVTDFHGQLETRGYLDRLFDDVPCFLGACNPLLGTSVQVTNGAATAGVDLALTRGGSISGRVFDAATGEPIENAGVRVFTPEGEMVARGFSDAGGRYTATGLAAGGYVLTVGAPLRIAVVHGGAPCAAECDLDSGVLVQVARERETAGIDVALSHVGNRGSLSGRVTDRDTGDGLAQVRVVVTDPEGERILEQTVTRADGTYAMGGLPAGEVRVHTHNTFGHADEVYDDVFCHPASCQVGEGEPIVVEDGVEITGVDFELARGGVIAGRVTDALGQPVNGARVQAFDEGGGYVVEVISDPEGGYEIGSLASGSYYVAVPDVEAFVDGVEVGFLGEVHGGVPCPARSCDVTTGQPVTVQAGRVTLGVDFDLRPGATLSGRVASADGGYGLFVAQVVVFDEQGAEVAAETTDATGAYVIRGLRTGTYFVATRNSFGYLDEVYADTPCRFQACDVTTGTPVVVDALDATRGLDFRLSWGGELSGTVVGLATGLPFRYHATIDVYAADGTRIASASTDGNGKYRIGGLPGGVYFVTATSPAAFGQVWDGVPCEETCEPVAGNAVRVRVGERTSGVDFVLEVRQPEP